MTSASTPPSDADVSRQVIVDGLTHRYRSKGESVLALDDINLTLEPGEFVCVVGPSGCGKTTLLRMLAGFLQPTGGEVRVGGKAVRAPAPERGVVFQQANLYPWLTVSKNVEYGLRMRGVRKKERVETARRYLELVGLAGFESRAPYELSGGMQQRCQIARVLALDPAIMLMDEPFGALDALTRERMQDELLRIWNATGKTIFFITHSVEEAVFLSTRVMVMSARPGRIAHLEEVPFSGLEADPEEDLRGRSDFIEIRERVSDVIYQSEDVGQDSEAHRG